MERLGRTVLSGSAGPATVASRTSVSFDFPISSSSSAPASSASYAAYAVAPTPPSVLSPLKSRSTAARSKLQANSPSQKPPSPVPSSVFPGLDASLSSLHRTSLPLISSPFTTHHSAASCTARTARTARLSAPPTFSTALTFSFSAAQPTAPSSVNTSPGPDAVASSASAFVAQTRPSYRSDGKDDQGRSPPPPVHLPASRLYLERLFDGDPEEAPVKKKKSAAAPENPAAASSKKAPATGRKKSVKVAALGGQPSRVDPPLLGRQSVSSGQSVSSATPFSPRQPIQTISRPVQVKQLSRPNSSGAGPGKFSALREKRTRVMSTSRSGSGDDNGVEGKKSPSPAEERKEKKRARLAEGIEDKAEAKGEAVRVTGEGGKRVEAASLDSLAREGRSLTREEKFTRGGGRKWEGASGEGKGKGKAREDVELRKAGSAHEAADADANAGTAIAVSPHPSDHDSPPPPSLYKSLASTDPAPATKPSTSTKPPLPATFTPPLKLLKSFSPRAVKADRILLMQEETERVLEDAASYRTLILSSADQPPVDRLQAFATKSLAPYGRRPVDLSPSSSLGAILRSPENAALANGLCQLAEQGPRFDWDEGVQAGWLREVTVEEVELGWVEGGGVARDEVEAEEEEEEFAEDGGEGGSRRSTPVTLTPEAYCRVFILSVREWREAFERYARERPADAAWARAGIEAVKAMDDDEYAAFAYGGQSLRFTSAGRAVEDDQGDSPSTRYTCFLSLNHLHHHRRFFQVLVTAPTFTLTTTRAAAKFAVRALQPFQDLEIVLIASLGPARLNSSPGGAVSHSLPSSDASNLRNAVQNVVFPSLPPHQQRSPRQQSPPSVKRMLGEHVDEVMEIWREVGESDWIPPTEFAVSDIRQTAGAVDFAPDGHVRAVSLLKDITKEEFFSTSEERCTFFGPRAGQAGHLAQEELSFLQPAEQGSSSSTTSSSTLSSSTLSSSTSSSSTSSSSAARLVSAAFSTSTSSPTTVSTVSADPAASASTSSSATPMPSRFPFVDVWAVTLCHREIHLALLCVIRYFLLTEAPVVRLMSSKLAGLVLDRQLARTLRPNVDDTALTSFTKHLSLANLDQSAT